MRATIKNYLEAMKQRREEEGEKGFSLIELIIVIVILGILVAVAIPIFLNVQQDARNNAAAAAAANAATQIAAQMAQDPDLAPNAVATANLTSDFDPVLAFTVTGDAGDIDTICVKVASGGGVDAAHLAGGAEEISAGPCPAAAPPAGS